jgi:putative zinc finger/helix-turn-helix YgiT family protein
LACVKAKEQTMRKCPTCGDGKLEAGLYSHEIDVGGISFHADHNLPGKRCTNTGCGEVLFGDEALARFELHVTAALAEGGYRSGTALRFMRHALGMRAAELAALVGVTPETFSRWETGERDVDPRAFALVGALARARLDRRAEWTEAALRAIASPQKLPGVPLRLAIGR